MQAVVAFVAFAATMVSAPTPAHAVGEIYGPYYLMNFNTAFTAHPQCLADPGSSTANNVHQILYACGNVDQLFFNETAVTNSDYWTYNLASGKCLVPYGGSSSSGAWIVQYTCNSAASARWVYKKVDPGFIGACPRHPDTGASYCEYQVFEIQNKSGSQQCIATQNGVFTQGTGVVQYPCNADTTNWWVQIKA
ncbi:RICIN domain-containing protein [Dactylosporangium vinaceum]|uniref:RICIN domain-containing protein n=1 Tax=Dactylosporangium vinaceum TaxID=53362 RepID=A0ABV5M7M4_9ACTN|nr:RICIN domain-containing protein [Dactylosporangium vinaceum]UAB95415.1 RICIN domain-containing protein [Dactylosporangium vinaceum]